MKVLSLIISLLTASMIISNASAKTEIPYYIEDFEDVNSFTLFNEGIHFLKFKEIAAGYEDGTYRPHIRINRVEFLKIVLTAAYPEEIKSYSVSSTCFIDVPVDSWYAKYVCFAKEKGIIGGFPDGTFKPERFIGFAESAKIIANAFELTNEENPEVWFRPFVEALGQKNAIPVTIGGFGHQISRGEMAEMIYRILDNISDQASRNYEDIVSLLDTFKPQNTLIINDNIGVSDEPESWGYVAALNEVIENETEFSLREKDIAVSIYKKNDERFLCNHTYFYKNPKYITVVCFGAGVIGTYNFHVFERSTKNIITQNEIRGLGFTFETIENGEILIIKDDTGKTILTVGSDVIENF